MRYMQAKKKNSRGRDLTELKTRLNLEKSYMR